MLNFGLDNMPVDIRLWLLNQRKQSELVCSKIKKERLEQLKLSYFDLLMSKRQIEQTKRLVNCLIPVKIEKE